MWTIWTVSDPIATLSKMSQIEYTPEIVSELRVDLLENWVVNALVALVAYDYFITIGQEVTMVWRRKWTAATWLFIINRYLLIVVMILANIHATQKTCSGVEITLSTLECAQYVVFAIFSGLRAYGLLGRTAFAACILLVVVSLNLVPLGTGIRWSTFLLPGPDLRVILQLFGQLARLNQSSVLALGGRIPLIASDVIVVLVTWLKTAGLVRHASVLQIGLSLGETLLRDGSLYFVALLGLNIAQMVVTVVPGLNEIDLFTQMNQVITPILISRFLLNLRQAASPGNSPGDSDRSDLSSAEFRRPPVSSFVGNMGEYLDHGPASEEEYDAGEQDEQAKATTSIQAGQSTAQDGEPSHM